MSTIAAKLVRKTSRRREQLVGVFYLVTFVAGGLFLFTGTRLSFAFDLTATLSYIAFTVLFYTLIKGT
jgi:hypothetical protein